MLIFVIAVAAVMIPILLGVVIAFASNRMDMVVKETKEAVENKDKGYSLALTLGHRIKVDADFSDQIKKARLLAAKSAAVSPRGANVKIGRLGHSQLQTAWQGVKEDPLTAVRIARYHGWSGVTTGAPSGGVAVAAPVAVAPATAPGGKIELVPGKDYPVIELTAEMSPDEKRKARIANSKAKSAAMKAAKAAQAGAVAVPVATTPVTAAPAAAQPVAMPAISIEPPQIVELTDDMSPDEKRKARIANSKAKSAFNKAVKAAGLDPKTIRIEGDKVILPAGAAVAPAAPAAQVAAPDKAVPAAAPAGSAPGVAAAASIPPPELTEITDDMAPNEKRQARIANAKAKSAYNKALKAAGIDPKSI